MFFLIAFLLGGGALGLALSGGGSDTNTAAGRTDDGDDPAPVFPLVVEDDPAPEPVSVDDDPFPLPGPPAPVVDDGEPTGDIPSLPDSAYDIGWAGLSPEEQLIVELVNRARLDPQAEVDRLNEELAAGISSSPVEALAVVPTLSDAAELHSEDMDNRDYFDHVSPEGERPWDRAVDEGHSTTFVGENIGWIGSTSTSFDAQARAEAHHSNLWHSDGHQQNLMSGNWSEIGLGYDYGDYRGYDGSTFVTELFSDTGKSYLTGVVIDDDDDDGFYDIGEGQGDVRITAYDGDETYATATWDSGGYSLALPPGTYRVVFEGGDLDQAYETAVTISNDNVKLDVIDEGGSAMISVNAGTPAPASSVMAMIFGEPDLDDAAPIAMEDEEDLILV